MTTIDVRDRCSVPCAGARLDFSADGEVTLSVDGLPPCVVRSPDLGLSIYVEVWCGDGFGYFAGLEARSLWYADAVTGQISRVLELERLDMEGRYDPGGLHRVSFRPLDDGTALVVYEYGLARVGPRGRAAWQYVHEDLTAHLTAVTDGAAWFDSDTDGGGFGVALRDGSRIAAR